MRLSVVLSKESGLVPPVSGGLKLHYIAHVGDLTFHVGHHFRERGVRSDSRHDQLAWRRIGAKVDHELEIWVRWIDFAKQYPGLEPDTITARAVPRGKAECPDGGLLAAAGCEGDRLLDLIVGNWKR